VSKGRELVVKPVSTYSTYERREATSWHAWVGITTERKANDKHIE